VPDGLVTAFRRLGLLKELDPIRPMTAEQAVTLTEYDHDHSNYDCGGPPAISPAILTSEPLFFRLPAHKFFNLLGLPFDFSQLSIIRRA
jgi:hypothetical protein